MLPPTEKAEVGIGTGRISWPYKSHRFDINLESDEGFSFLDDNQLRNLPCVSEKVEFEEEAKWIGLADIAEQIGK